jgi:hypothetical protein
VLDFNKIQRMRNYCGKKRCRFMLIVNKNHWFVNHHPLARLNGFFTWKTSVFINAPRRGGASMAVHPDSDGGRTGRSPLAGGLIPLAIARSFGILAIFIISVLVRLGKK